MKTVDDILAHYSKPKEEQEMQDKMRERFLPGGDKWESIKADEAWEKAHAEDDHSEDGEEGGESE